MVERVARAITNPEIWDEALLKFYGDLWMYAEQNKARANAKRAIEAMREPTPEMTEHAFAGTSLGYDDDEKAKGAWENMIDAALK